MATPSTLSQAELLSTRVTVATANTGTALSGADLIFKGGTCLAKVCQKLTSARTPAISAGSAERSVGTTYCRSGVMRTAGVRA